MGNEGSTNASHPPPQTSSNSSSFSATTPSSLSSSSSSHTALSTLEKFLGQVPNHQPEQHVLTTPHNAHDNSTQQPHSGKSGKVPSQQPSAQQSQKSKKPVLLQPSSSSSSNPVAAGQPVPASISSSATPIPSLSPAIPLSGNPSSNLSTVSKDGNLSHVPSYSQLSNPSGSSGPFPMPSSHLITKRLPLGPGEAFDAHFQEKHSKKKKLSVEDFELLKVVGKGSFGKVMQVKKKSNGKIYAMKVLKKDHLIKRKQIVHTKTERKILQEIKHPGQL